MAERGVAEMLVERLNWQHADSRFDTPANPGWIAKPLAYLFGVGSILLFLSLLLPGTADHEPERLAIVAGASLLVCIFIRFTYGRLPLWFLRAAPAIGTLFFALAIYFGGADASAAYAMYMVWVVIAAALFLDIRLILAHGALAVAAYAFVLFMRVGVDDLDPLRVMMTAGTMLVVALVMGGIAGQLREVLRTLEAAAGTDPLTGLLNRRDLEEAFEIELARAARGKFGVGVVMLDLDGFKRFNDQHGHPAGDAALQRLAQVLTDASRTIDSVGRVGGEEFAIIAPESSTAGTLALAERLRRAVELEFSGIGGLTASVGVASYPDNGTDRATLIGAADRALYRAKDLGRNRAVAASPRAASASRAVPN